MRRVDMRKTMISRRLFCYLTARSHSSSAYFEDGIPKLTTNFGLVPPLGDALAARKIAGPTGGHLRNMPVTLLPGNAAGIRRLEQVFRIAVAFMVVDEVSHSTLWLLLSLFPTEKGTKKNSERNKKVER